MDCNFEDGEVNRRPREKASKDWQPQVEQDEHSSPPRCGHRATARQAKVSNPAQTAMTSGKLLNALWSTRTNDYGPRMKSCICKCKNYSDDHNINAFLLLMEIARLLKNEAVKERD